MSLRTEVIYQVTRFEDEDCEMDDHIYFSRPQIVSILKHDRGSLVQARELKYFQEPKTGAYPLDLNIGLDRYVFYKQYKFRSDLQKIEFYLMKNDAAKVKMTTCGDEQQVEVYACKMALEKIMQIPYCYGREWMKQENVTIRAIKYNGVLYLMHIKPEKVQFHGGPAGSNVQQGSQSCDKKREAGKDIKRSGTYYNQFKNFCFTDKPSTEPDILPSVDENNQQYGIYRARLKNFDITYTAEIDGVMPNEAPHNIMGNLTQLSTAQHNFVQPILLPEYLRNRDWKQEHRFFKFWIKGYLAGVNNMFIAFKNHEGIIKHQGALFKPSELSQDQLWKPFVCNRFLLKFLSMINNKMALVNCPFTVYEFFYDCSTGCIKCSEFPGATGKSFLSKNFIEHLCKF